MPEPVVIELDGHPAIVGWIKAQITKWPFKGPDCLSVWVDFIVDPRNEGLGLLGFGFQIDAKDYAPEELRAVLKEAGEAALREQSEKSRKDKETREDEERRQKSLNTLGESLFSKLTDKS